jgi:hypothetical protein
MFGHDAIHEAGHVVGALFHKLAVQAVLIKSSHKPAARCYFDPMEQKPLAVYSMKMAGMVAVEINNAKHGRSDDNGFGKPDDPESDAYCVECLKVYLMAFMDENRVRQYYAHLRAKVRDDLCGKWPLVEALAAQFATLGPEQCLTAARIGEIIKSHDQGFYDENKNLLV